MVDALESGDPQAKVYVEQLLKKYVELYGESGALNFQRAFDGVTRGKRQKLPEHIPQHTSQEVRSLAVAISDGRTLDRWTEIVGYETLNAAIAALRQLGHELNCPVLVVAERNRGTMSTGGLSAGAGTRKIEYGAETVLDMERDANKREDAAGEIEISVKFAKNRHGAAGKKVSLFFQGALQKFRE